ncbi:UvrD-helicase domain-containing protein [Pseudomonas aeruginosa]|uniref:UvrD-helicase domain-containing protein n=1 Tax=Pseudomonas aeruginosa TaxID=287 RepID=UPI00374A0F5C
MVTLVDEFQDCGANTITWLRGVFAELRRRGTRQDSPRGVIYPSLMAVGDDWQSIYGWRCGFHADSDTHSTHIRTVIPR